MMNYKINEFKVGKFTLTVKYSESKGSYLEEPYFEIHEIQNIWFKEKDIWVNVTECLFYLEDLLKLDIVKQLTDKMEKI